MDLNNELSEFFRQTKRGIAWLPRAAYKTSTLINQVVQDVQRGHVSPDHITVIGRGALFRDRVNQAMHQHCKGVHVRVISTRQSTRYWRRILANGTSCLYIDEPAYSMTPASLELACEMADQIYAAGTPTSQIIALPNRVSQMYYE